MKKNCPRTLDKPILLFGLETEEVAMIILLAGIGSLILGPLYPGIFGILSWFGLIEFKKDKPSGYLIHYLYAQGLSMPGLIRSFKLVKKYAVK